MLYAHLILGYLPCLSLTKKGIRKHFTSLRMFTNVSVYVKNFEIPVVFLKSTMTEQ